METQPTPEKLIGSMYDAAEVALAALMIVYDSQAELTADTITARTSVDTGFEPTKTAEIVKALFDGNQPYLMTSQDFEGTCLGTTGLWQIETALLQDAAEIDPIEIAKQALTRTKVIAPINAWEKYSAGVGRYPQHLVHP